MSRTVRTIAFVALISVAVFDAHAAGTRRLVNDGIKFLDGEMDGVVLDELLQLRPAPVSAHTWSTSDFYVWSLARDARGRIVAGTGDGGTLHRENGDELEPWVKTLALEVLSLMPWGDDILAGTSPDGVIYRIDEAGEHRVALDLPLQSVWALAPARDSGSWLAGGGPGARLVRVSSSASAGEQLHEFPATNLTAMVRDGETLWVATQGPGLLYRIDGDEASTPRLVLETKEGEIRSIVSDAEGGLYVLSLELDTKDDKPLATSRITWLASDGGWETLYEGDEALLSLARLPDGSILAGERENGRLHRFTRGGARSLYAELGAGDPLCMIVDPDGVCVVGLGNLGQVVRLSPGEKGGGEFVSAVLEANHNQRWGRLWIDGEASGVRVSTRSGVRPEPDDTWSDWSSPRRAGEVVDSPVAPYLQYRLQWGDGNKATVTGVRVAYSERNLAPRVRGLRVESTGGELMLGGASSSPPPVSQRFEDGLAVEYSVYKSRQTAAPDLAAWARGIRTVVWSGEDPNGDELRYEVEVRRDPEGDWTAVATNSSERVYAWDTRSFEDGSYRVRVTAHDGHSNTPPQQRTTSAVSAPVFVDNAAPRIRRLEWNKERGMLLAEVDDESSVLVEVSVRIDDEIWTPIEPQDGVLDAPRERFEVPLTSAGSRLWVRAVDAAGNVALKDLPRR